MVTVHTQIHGYKQGHQLLEASAGLEKQDQSVIERLSDLAGPLRPGEVFPPYISAYPLPSGQYYILAKTWQDPTVARAGCVRTLSLVIPADAWAFAASLKAFFDYLDSTTFPTDARPIAIAEDMPLPIPAAPPFAATELLEALFLEEAQPVVVFDAPDPELIVLRLLTAIWPELRRRFALSTFALSPRKLEDRSFDLVFAPRDAKARFASWPGRRIDGHFNQTARHRWTHTILGRVFEAPLPSLLGQAELRLVGTGHSGTPSAVRIALLWNELLGKLERTPSAALGLLDIAQSRMESDPEVVLALRPALGDAAHRAVIEMTASEAREFIAALARKLHGTELASAMPAVAGAAGVLAIKSPPAAISLLEERDPNGATNALVPQIAICLREHFGAETEAALQGAQPKTFVRLIKADEALATRLVDSPVLISRLAKILPELSRVDFDALKKVLLPLLVNDTQIAAARPFLESLDIKALIEEVRHLALMNGFAAGAYIAPIVERAHQLQAGRQLRNELLDNPSSKRRDDFLYASLSPTADDVHWLLNARSLDHATAMRFLKSLLRAASVGQLRDIFAKPSLANELVDPTPEESSETLTWIVEQVPLPLPVQVAAVLRLLTTSSNRQQPSLARLVLEQCFRENFGGDEVGAISKLLTAVGSNLDSRWVARRALGKDLAPSLENRNIVACNKSGKAARLSIISSIEDVAEALAERYALQMDEEAADACAELLWDAQSANAGGLLRAAGRLLPTLLRSRRVPVSAMVAATFPAVYRELAKETDVPELLKFVPFLDWDRCKTARRELTNAFLGSSVWKPSDLALTACRTSDSERILKRVAKAYNGETYIDRISGELSLLPKACRDVTTSTIERLRSDWEDRHRWRD